MLLKWTIRMLLLGTLVAVAAGIGGYMYIQKALMPVEASEEVTIDIPPGSSALTIADKLEQSGVIRDALVFRGYVKYKGVENDFQAGTYVFPRGIALDDVISKLTKGDVVRDTVRFTIPEGLSVLQVADRLAKQGIVDRETFLKEINEGQFDFAWLSDIPQSSEERPYRLEGFLFPETYEVDKGSTEHEIIRRMLSQFDKEWKPEWREELNKKDLSLYEIVTLASIVEREVVADKERPIVAGIFYNRLKDGWMLQSCATVQFVLGKQRDRITFADLEVKSPYNTYIHEGLPPGPIASPGRASLKSVVYPEATDYYFFVTKKDGSQEHLFARTFAEHQKNDANSRGNW
jgi:UPF0755 protein